MGAKSFGVSLPERGHQLLDRGSQVEARRVAIAFREVRPGQGEASETEPTCGRTRIRGAPLELERPLGIGSGASRETEARSPSV